MKKIVIMLTLISALWSGSLQDPSYVYKIDSGIVSDILYSNEKLYVATDNGHVDIFNTQTKQKVKTVTLEKIFDFMGDEVASKIFSLDIYEGILLILSQDSGGYSRIDLYKNGTLTQVVSKEEHLNIIKAKFLDKNHVVMALISNDILSFDIKNKKIIWTTQASMSKFSNFALNPSRTKVAIADESGEVHIIDTKNGAKVQKLSGENVDNIFSIAYKGGKILTGGQDRRAAVYNLKNGEKYHKSSQFFVYGVGLSPSGDIGAYSCDMDNNVELFNTATQEPLGKFRATKMIVNSINFINEKEFFINSSAKSVGYYITK